MFFENLADIPKIAEKVGCSIFVVPKDAKTGIKDAIILEPTTKVTITIDQVREVLGQFTTKLLKPQFIMISPADKLGEEAENAILKNLEEPKENLHFVLITDQPSKLLPTILSRAALYIWRDGKTSLKEISADDKTKALAKKFLVAKDRELVDLAEELTKKKDGVREYVLDILSVAIEMAYKSYFITSKSAFLAKIPKLLNCYENISRNGHIKLHLVADLM
ncbi:hypothetical protein IKG07_01290 [Candidatus Saccharibacteria bacterium]|nr:hypothetical protein [Candidatus Saccharibacteria bacterium]